MRVYDNLSDTFGNTPLVKIPRLNKGLGGHRAREDGVVQTRAAA